MENRPLNWSVDRYAITPKQCISTFTRHIFHSSKMYACTTTRIDVGSAVTRYGIKHLCCEGMSAHVRGGESLRYYPYRATFDFECWFDTEQLSSDSDKVHWVARHVPLSVSVASNVPVHEQVQSLVTDGDTNKLVSAMMDILQAMSDAAYDNIKDSYDDVSYEDVFGDGEPPSPKRSTVPTAYGWARG